MNTDEKIDRLMMFTNKLFQHQNTRDFNQRMELREWLNQNVQWVRREVIEAGCQKIMTISPPPALGGLIMRRLDPFDHMFGAPYGVDLVSEIPDMIDATIGVLRNPPPRHAPSGPIIKATIQSGYAFVAMPIDKDDHQLVDVLEAIKDAAAKCGVTAERVDDVCWRDEPAILNCTIFQPLYASLSKEQKKTADRIMRGGQIF